MAYTKNSIEQSQINAAIQHALSEDIGSGDVTTQSIISENEKFGGHFLAKADGVVAGLDLARMVFDQFDKKIDFSPKTFDGRVVEPGEILATLEGSGRTILAGERTALNFLQRMSGIATTTRSYVEAVAGTNAKILDTRKTVPGLRIFDKWAVELGGGVNHRFGLFDMILIKDNHIAAAGSITEAVERVRKNKTDLPIEVEVKDLNELQEAIGLGPDRIMLDNMNIEQMSQAVEITAGKFPLEASGGITLENVRRVAMTGVDFISVGALTHSVKALDISLELGGKSES